MKWRCILALCLILSACAQTTDNPTETARTGLELTVPGDFATIQEALNAASYGDTVLVAPGDYTENVTLNEGVTLKGSGPDKTVLRGQVRFFGTTGGVVTGLTVTADGASGFSPNVGISVDGEIFTVTGNVVEGFGSGIGVEATVEGQVTGNLVRNNEIGIEVIESADVLIANNVVLNNKNGGIFLFGFSTLINIVHNTVVGNGFAKPYDEGGAGIVIGPFNNEQVQNNIVVSNKGGMNSMDGTNSKNHHNLVWGNVDNYVGDASAASGDLSLDPVFANPGNKDYRLTATSPALDAAVVWANVEVDFDGNPRVVGDLPDLGAFELPAAAEGGDFIITEVMANPLVESTGEFVELFNATGTTLDAAGLVLDDGDSTDDIVGFDGGPTTVASGAYAVILDKDYDLATGPYEIPAEAVLLTVPNKTLGSGLSVNDPVTMSRGGALVSTYLHPFNPGNGLSAEKVTAEGDDTPDNWVPSQCGSSPGKANCISSGEGPTETPTIIITEVMAWPLKQTSEEFVEVYNFGDQPVDLVGLHISDGASTDSIIAVPGKESILPPGTLGIIIDPDLENMESAPYYLNEEVPVVVTVATPTIGNGLTGDDTLVMTDTDGATMVATFSRSMYIKHQSVERIDPEEADIFDNWIQCPCPAKHSAGRPNCAYETGEQVDTPELIITEVMANALDEDTGEFVELYNPGDEPVNLAGFRISDGDSKDTLEVFTPGGSLVIPAKGYGLILDPEYDNDYSIPAGTALMRPQNTTIGNGLSNSDPITLLAADGKTSLSTYSFPFNAGNGISVERVGNAGDVAGNWLASPCATGSSPGAANCASGGEDPQPEPDPTGPQPVISEVMANPVVESSEEFVEIVNIGDEPIDLAGWIITDGDSTDTIEGFAGGPTMVPAGAYAVVLDAQYPADGPYTIPEDAVLLTTDDLTIGSGLSNNDPVSLLQPDGAVTVTTYAYPFNAGNGKSAERISLESADDPDNWAVSSCQSGSSPGAPNCVAGEPVVPGVTVVDVNTANSEQLQQVGGIGPATASAIVAYRDANGTFDSLVHLTVIDSITTSKLADWQTAEDGEPEFVIGMESEAVIQVYTEPGDLLDMLPAPDSAEASQWDGALVRIKRCAMFTDNDSESNQDLLVGDWGDQGLYTPNGAAQIPVYLGAAPAEGVYVRSLTDHANAMADWKKEDSDPYNVPNFYRWPSGLPSWGIAGYGAVYALEGLVELYDGQWRIRIRAKADSGIDRLVMIERWLEAESWAELKWIWSYNYKSVVVDTVSGFTWTLPYRLSLAHPARAYWLETHGETIDLPHCFTSDQCGPAVGGGWDLFNLALAEWKETPTEPATGYCFTSDSVEYCFTEDEEETGLDILNNANMGQLKDHCFTTTQANVILANRPFASIEAFDDTSGIGPKSLWSLLVCYVRSGHWPPAPPGSIQEALQNIPGNEWKCLTIDGIEVNWRDGKLFEVCDIGTTHCIKVYSQITLVPTLDAGDIVSMSGEMQLYAPGNYWNLVMKSYCGSLNFIDDN